MKYRYFQGYAVVVTAEGAKIIKADVQSRFNVHMDEIVGRFDGQQKLRKAGVEYCVIGYFKIKQDAEFCLKYTKTKFFRFMLDMAKIAQFNPLDSSFITEKAQPPYWWRTDNRARGGRVEIDWSADLSDIDAQLYKHFGFGKPQINFIEERYGYDGNN